MGQTYSPSPVLLFTAAFSRHEEALAWCGQKFAAAYGPLAILSPAFEFTETDYYNATMGSGLKKQFFACEQLLDPAQLIKVKQQTNAWELEYAALGLYAEERPLNIDPGYLTLAKLVLATTKDHAHRLYLGDGIYGEVTLNFRGGGWQPCEWTYPDYRRADFQSFFTQCRELHKRLSRGG